MRFFNILIGLTAFLFFGTVSEAQVNTYSFAQSSGTYTEITGGTVLGTATSNSGATGLDDVTYTVNSLPSFAFNGTPYTTLYVTTNGFITFGADAGGSARNPISQTTVYDGAVAPWGGDNSGMFNINGFTSELRYEVLGSSPNSIIVIQWKNFRPTYSTSTTNAPYVNYQIRLHETTNEIEIVYGPSGHAIGTTNVPTTKQIGLRGATNADFHNRTNSTTVSFNASTQGTSNSNTQAYSSINATPGTPANGLTYTFTPPIPCTGTPEAGTISGTLVRPTCGGLNPSPTTAVATGYTTGQSGITFQWETSTDNATWSNATGTGSTTPAYTLPAHLAGQTEYYRLKVTCTDSGLFDVSDVVVEVTDPTAPVTQASNVSTSVLGDVNATITWTNGSGTRRYVVLNTVNSFTDPVGTGDVTTGGTVYSGAGEQIVYDGTLTSVAVTGLTANTTYYVRVYEYHRCTGTTNTNYYNISTATDNPGSFTTSLYCSSVPTSNDGLGITNVVIGATSFPVADVTYFDNTATVIDIQAGANIASSVTFATGYTYHTHFWIDLNDDGVFDNVTEKFFSGESTNSNPTTLNTSFDLPPTAQVGQHRLRIGTADNGQSSPNPCYSGAFGVTVDVTVNVLPPSTDEMDWVNLQHPASAAIDVLGSVDVYAQGYEAGLTDNTTGQAPGIQVWIGTSSTDTDPAGAGWTWTVATFNTEANGNNNDEYQAAIGADLAPGTYYYASRWSLNNGPFKYGGYNAGGGGFWDGINNVSGVLTVNPLVNDECAGAIAFPTIPTDETCVSVTVNTAGATGSPDATCIGTEDNDVWYTFTVPAGYNSLLYENTTISGSGDRMIQILTACGGTSIGCYDPETGAITGLTGGSTYILRTYTYFSGTTSEFTLCLKTPPPPPANDECASAIVLGVESTTTCTSPTAGTTVGATQSPDLPQPSGSNDDVWYSFEAVDVAHTVLLSGATNTTGAAIYGGTCGSLGTALASGSTSSGNATITVNGLTIGNTYLVRVYSTSSSSTVFSDFNICIATPPGMTYVSSTTTQSPTANVVTGSFDQQIIRTVVVVSGASSPLSVTNIDYTTALSSLPATDIATAKVYYTGTSTTFSTTTPFGTPVANPNGSFSVSGTQVLAGGAANTSNYFWLVYDIAPDAIAGNVVDATCESVTVGGTPQIPTATNPAGSRTIVAAATNDNAINAITIPLGTGCTSGSNFNSTTHPNEPANCFTQSNFSVWYKFTAPASGGVKVTTDLGATTGMTDSRLALYAATDPNDYSTFTVLACDDDNGITSDFRSTFFANELTPGTDYYVQVTQFSTTAPNATTGAFCLEVQELTSTMVAPAATCSTPVMLPGSFGASPTYTGWTSLLTTTGELALFVRKPTGINQSTYILPSLNVNTGAVRQDGNGIFYLDRNFSIGHADAGPFEIKMPFLETELNALITADPTAVLASLNVTHVQDAPCATGPFGSTNTLLTNTGTGLANGVAWVKATSPSFSGFFIHAGNTPLPVTILSFDAKAQQDKTVNLSWQVADEVNVQTYNIERSSDNKNWSAIGAVNANLRSAYGFKDMTPLNGINYYRLAVKDINASVAYSQVRAVQFSANAELALFPNPAQSKVYISGATDRHVVATVFNEIGQAVATYTMSGADLAAQGVDISRLLPGAYSIQIKGEASVQTMRFVKGR